jgi:hypothetical protein
MSGLNVDRILVTRLGSGHTMSHICDFFLLHKSHIALRTGLVTAHAL